MANDSNYMVYTKHKDATYSNPKSKMFSSESSDLYHTSGMKKSQYKDKDSFYAINDFRTPLDEGDFKGKNQAATDEFLDEVSKNSNYYMSYSKKDGIDIQSTLNSIRRNVGLSPIYNYDDGRQV